MGEVCPQFIPVGRPPQIQYIWPAMFQGPNSNLSLGFRASIPRGLTPRPPELRTPEQHLSNLPSTWMEPMPLGAALNLQRGRNLHVPLKPLLPSVAPQRQTLILQVAR